MSSLIKTFAYLALPSQWPLWKVLDICWVLSLIAIYETIKMRSVRSILWAIKCSKRWTREEHKKVSYDDLFDPISIQKLVFQSVIQYQSSTICVLDKCFESKQDCARTKIFQLNKCNMYFNYCTNSGDRIFSVICAIKYPWCAVGHGESDILWQGATSGDFGIIDIISQADIMRYAVFFQWAH